MPDAKDIAVVEEEKLASPISTSFESLPSFRSDPRSSLVFLATAAERANRFEDMCKYASALVTLTIAQKCDLNSDERILFSVAFKNTVGDRRTCWRALHSDPATPFDDLVQHYRKTVEQELKCICSDALSLLEKLLALPDLSTSASVFYLKMCGDYHRYGAELFVYDYSAQSPNGEEEAKEEEKQKEEKEQETEKQKAEHHEKTKAIEFYEKALHLAETKLESTDPTRLGLALNASVCYYEILKDRKRACELAKGAFDAAISDLNHLSMDTYKDSTLILQLLRDNMVLWMHDSSTLPSVPGEYADED